METELTESPSKDISGFGDSVVKITDGHGRTVCFIGRKTNEPKELVHFPSPVSVEVIASVQSLLEKRKMRKALNNGNYEKAQKFADRKWGEVYSG